MQCLHEHFLVFIIPLYAVVDLTAFPGIAIWNAERRIISCSATLWYLAMFGILMYSLSQNLSRRKFVCMVQYVV